MGERECEKKWYVWRKAKLEGNLKIKGKWEKRDMERRVYGNKEKKGNVRICEGEECFSHWKGS